MAMNAKEFCVFLLTCSGKLSKFPSSSPQKLGAQHAEHGNKYCQMQADQNCTLQDLASLGVSALEKSSHLPKMESKNDLNAAY